MRKRVLKFTYEMIEILKSYKDDIRDRFKVKEIGMFGSYVRDDQKGKSDIDILVEFEQKGLTFDNYMELKFYLEEVFSGKVDLVIKDSVKPSIKSFILKEVVYV